MKRFSVFFVLLCSLVNFTACTNKENEPAPKQDGFNARFLSVGKADCTIIQMDGMSIICDTAETDDYTYIASKLKAENINTIDAMILTHFDKDHIGSAPFIIKNFNIKTVYLPDYTGTISEYKALMQAIKDMHTRVITVKTHEEIKTENGKLLIAPPKTISDADNNNSLITTVEYRGKSVLLTGDALKSRLKDFLSDDTEHLYDIIKLPHHGDYNKALVSLFSNANARYGVITSDKERSTVSDKLLSAMETYQIQPLYTADGDIEFAWDGTEIALISGK